MYARKYTRKPKMSFKPKKTIVKGRKNVAKQVNKNTKFIKQIRDRTYGEYQHSLQTTENALVPTVEAPCLINATCAQVNAVVWQPVLGAALPGGSTGGAPTPHSVTKFIKPSYLHTGFWSGAQDDVINGKHLLLKSEYIFEVTFTRYTYSQTVRIDCFTVKKALINSLKQNKQLPNSISQLHSMATSQNKFNPTYFKKFGKPKFITCPGDTALGAYDVNQHEYRITKYAKCVLNHNRVITPRIELTIDQDDEIGDPFTVPTSTIQAEQDAYGFISMPPDEVLWILISSSADGFQDHLPSINVTRHVSWRDHQGAAV
jgi:hypothetical protein